jgi:hypothetical protein
VHVARERAIDRRHAAALNATYERALRRLLEHTDTKTYALATLISDAVVRAGVVAIVDPGSREIPDLVRLAGQAGAALFALGHGGGGPLDVPLNGAPKSVQGKPEDSQLYVQRWLDAYFAAILARDHASMTRLLETSTDELRRSPTRGDEFLYCLVDVFRSLARGDDEAARDYLSLALDKSDRESVRMGPMDRVDEVDVPILAALGRLLEKDAVGFQAAIRNALELHARYWSEGERADDLAGLVCVRAGALLVLARQRGLAVEISSDYVPAALLVD